VFSADGALLVTASDDRAARVWNAATGKALSAPLDHDHRVIAMAWSADGRRLVTASDDETARVWTLFPDTGSLEDWQRLAWCSLFVLDDDGTEKPNPDPGALAECGAINARASR
jgi:WD40 repeat protein